MQNSQIIKIRATQRGVSIVCDDQAAPADLTDALRTRLQSHAQFYTDADVKLDIGNRIPDQTELAPLRLLIEEEFHLRLSSIVCSQDALLKQASQAWGCLVEVQDDSVMESSAKPSEPEIPQAGSNGPEFDQRSENGRETLIVRQTCRSGMTVTSPGNIVIIGNVNPGADIIAQNDIIVVGVLRGNAHAGAGGDTSAVIIALALQPKQIRIASHIGLPPASEDPPDRLNFMPEVAYVDENQIVIEPYTGRLPVA